MSSDARKRAEEALAHYETCPGGGRWRECSSALAVALRALLAAEPAKRVEPPDLVGVPVHFVSVLPRGRIFMHPDTPKSGLRDPWPPPMTVLSEPATAHAPDPDPPAGAEVREAAERLREKMQETYDDPRYMNVWATAQERLGPYTGPNWIAEAEALDAAIRATASPAPASDEVREAAEVISRIYYEIASDAVGEDRVRTEFQRRFALALAALRSDGR